MESDGEDLDNIFEEYENTENDTGAGNTEAGQTTNETSSAVKITAPKRIVKNPRLKFNPERLCGERGIPVLVDHFKHVKFKGMGHEKEDLDKLLSKLEHWTHRLFPSMKFEDCLNHIEKLGKKRMVQTCLRKIRLDMPILTSDFVKDDDEDDVQRNDDPEPEEIDAFDRLIKESQDISNSNILPPENVPESSSFYSSPMPNETSNVLGSSFGPSITEEQKERMERNKMLAAERRKAKLASLQQNSVDSQSATHKAIPSQNISTAQDSFDKFFDSSFKNRENTQSIGYDSGMEISDGNNERAKESSIELNNENSENLELDDLIDLVDEEEPVPDTNSAALSSEQVKTLSSNVDKTDRFSQNNNEEINCSNFEKNENVSVLDNADNEMALPLKTFENTNEENLGIDSLLDLVDENSEDCQQYSDSSHLVKDSSMYDFDKENAILDANEELTTMDCEDASLKKY